MRKAVGFLGIDYFNRGSRMSKCPYSFFTSSEGMYLVFTEQESQHVSEERIGDDSEK